MATDNDRFYGGPRPLAALLPRITRPAFKRRSPAGAQIMADWPGVVGPELAAVTIPRKLAAATLTIGCSGPTALELTYLAPEIITRINGNLGAGVVQRLRFVHEVGRDVLPPRPKATLPIPPRVGAAIAGVASEALRAALEKLARGVYRARN